MKSIIKQIFLIGVFEELMGLLKRLIVKYISGISQKFMTICTVSTPQNDSFYQEFIWWLSTNCEEQSLKYKVCRNGDDIRLVPTANNFIITYNNTKLYVNYAETQKDGETGHVGSPSSYTPNIETYTIKVFGKNKSIINDFMNHVLNAYQNSFKGLIHIYINNDYQDYWINLTSIPLRDVNSVILPKDTMSDLLEDIEHFLTREDFYLSKGIPYRRGYLFYGLPGTGKTSLIQVIATKCDLPIYFLRLSSLTLNDDMLQKLISNLPKRCVLVIEDVDVACVNGFKPIINQQALELNNKMNNNMLVSAQLQSAVQSRTTMVSGISYSGLLNSIDGLYAGSGRILVMTTNHKEKLEPALIRAGRIDKQIEFTYATVDQLVRIYENFYPFQPNALQFAQKLVDKKVTMGEVQQYLLLFVEEPDKALFHIDDFDSILKREKND